MIDWSLKGKRRYGFKVHRGSTFGDKYLCTDIETLRQKLVDDFKLLQINDSRFRVTGFQDELTKIINKRFGVE